MAEVGTADGPAGLNGAALAGGLSSGTTAGSAPFGLTDLHITKQTDVYRNDMHTNPAFDIRAQAARPDGRGPKFRGRMILVQRATPPGHQFALNFLWNPGSITTTYGFQQNAYSTDNITAEAASIPNLVSGMDVSFQLRFNRQYECHKDANNMGVLEDVAALERMVGAYHGGAMQSVPVQVIFGGVAGLRLFAFTGILSQIAISYVLFTQKMIPTVADVNVSITRTLVGGAATVPYGGGVASYNTGSGNYGNVGNADGGARAGGGANFVGNADGGAGVGGAGPSGGGGGGVMRPI